jgi:hypothetical protein
MRLSQRTNVAVGAAIAVLACSGLAIANGYEGPGPSGLASSPRNFTGTWPVTVSRSQFNNGTGCLTLTAGASGTSASLSFGGQTYRNGSFTIIDDLVMVTITQPEGSQNGALLFVGPAGRGHIGPGSFELVSGGANFDAGKLAFGMKNGC